MRLIGPRNEGLSVKRATSNQGVRTQCGLLLCNETLKIISINRVLKL